MHAHADNTTLVLGLAALLTLAAPQTAFAEPDLETGKTVYQDANCIGCHKWHGGGGGGYGGAALSLRETALDRDLLIEVIACGRPATRMPYHARGAYTSVDCYGGSTKDDFGSDAPPKAAKLLRDRQIEAVADYLIAKLQGQGEATFEQCIDFWGDGARQCSSMKE
ncbi:MAG: c-type cytochrome [Geminicoccaceae bacterium]